MAARTLAIALALPTTALAASLPSDFNLRGLPAMRWLNDMQGDAVASGDELRKTTGRETDWFNPPPGEGMPAGLANAPALVFDAPAGKDWQLSAQVNVAHQFLFDAATLFVHQGKDDWCKLCYEYSPERRPTVVSVVTRGVSDDANGQIVEGGSVHLRVSKAGPVVAFHYSTDGGEYWTLHRIFCLRDPQAPMAVGFLAQSPTGETCTAAFAQIQFGEHTLADPRDGS